LFFGRSHWRREVVREESSAGGIPPKKRRDAVASDVGAYLYVEVLE